MAIKEYIANKEYHLRLKTIMPLDDEIMDRIEMALGRYMPVSVSRPTKTILQRQPLDFPNVDAAEVYIVDMVLGIPAAPHVVRADIRKVLDAPENYVFVRNRNEPGELQSEIINALSDIETEAEKRGLTLMPLLTDPDYNDAENPDGSGLYGTEYNTALLGYLAKIEQERKDSIQRVVTAPFTWLELPDRKDQEPVQDDSNYNAHIKDAPMVAPAPSLKPDVSYNIFGNLDPNARQIRRVYQDAKGNKIVLSRKLSDGVK
jgi:hypothetical protein